MKLLKTLLLGTTLLGALVITTPVIASDFRFPWADTTQWSLWKNDGDAWHDHNPDRAAIDMGSSGGDRRVLATADGRIEWECVGNLTRDFRINHNGVVMWYSHIDITTIDESKVYVGARVQQGQILGELWKGWLGTKGEDGAPDKDGDDMSCGHTAHAYQGDDYYHLHWTLPTNHNPITVDGWEIKIDQPHFTKDGQEGGIWHMFDSTNVPYNGDVACGSQNVYQSWKNITTRYNYCFGDQSVTVSNSTVSGDGQWNLGTNPNGKVILKNGFHAGGLSNTGRVWAYVNGMY